MCSIAQFPYLSRSEAQDILQCYTSNVFDMKILKS